MSFSIKYKPVFEVQILHDFFLNKGNQQFNAMNEMDKKRRLKVYDFSRFLQVILATETLQEIIGRKLVFRISPTGFSVWSKTNDLYMPETEIEDNLSFTFFLIVSNPVFFNYTAIGLENSDKLFYLSNKKPSGEPASFPLIQLAGSNSKISDLSYLSAENQLKETKRIPGNIKPLAVVRIYVKGESSQLNLTDGSGALRNPATVFSVQFTNRKTTWRYIFRTNQVVKPNDDVKKEGSNSNILITKTEHPLTETGFIPIELNNVELPNPETGSVKPDLLMNKYYSEIYM
jgi:hypothetical protein